MHSSNFLSFKRTTLLLDVARGKTVHHRKEMYEISRLKKPHFDGGSDGLDRELAKGVLITLLNSDRNTVV